MKVMAGLTGLLLCMSARMSKTHQASCAPSSHKSLKETDKGDLTTEFMASLYSLNTLKTEQMSSVRMLNALHGSWVETKIKCHHWAVGPRLTESQPAPNVFSQPRKPLCKALRDVHLSSRFQMTFPKELNQNETLSLQMIIHHKIW